MKKLLLPSIVATVFISVANAAPYEFGNTAGFYTGLNLGYGKVDIKNTALQSSDMRGFTWNMDLGYQFDRFVALAGGYTAFHNAPNTDTDGWSLYLKGMIPFKQQWDAFAKMGLMRLSYKNPAAQTHTSLTPEFGAGVAYNINANFAVSTQAITTLSDTASTPATYAGYLGASYRFTV